MKKSLYYILVVMVCFSSTIVGNVYYDVLNKSKPLCAYLACSALAFSPANATVFYVIATRQVKKQPFLGCGSFEESVRLLTVVGAVTGLFLGALYGFIGSTSRSALFKGDYALAVPLIIGLAVGAGPYVVFKNNKDMPAVEMSLAVFLAVALGQYAGLVVAQKVA